MRGRTVGAQRSMMQVRGGAFGTSKSGSSNYITWVWKQIHRGLKQKKANDIGNGLLCHGQGEGAFF
jgi:hypothetical protein